MTRTTCCSAPGPPRESRTTLWTLRPRRANLTGYEAFVTDVAAFEANRREHGLENLINAIDPSAFYEQTTAGIIGTIADAVAPTWFRTTPSATWPRVWTTVC